ncbi:TPA: hypothetical protein DGT35_00330 [Patescibacteria group bacterium]|jgi:GTP pyrophosphokinase|nr:hypothetical protein [Patescibacteria group bacterium]|tara:strand:- start:3121 stop:4803 length:1683 start_codon:yes stop_codon:yes gene_type:complete
MHNLKSWIDHSPVVKKAYYFAQKTHAGQKKYNGQHFFDHVVKTARTITEWRLDGTAIAAALLHDVVDHASVTLEEVRKEFGEDIHFLVSGASNLRTVNYRGEKGELENIRKFVLATSKDIRVLLIKLADLLDNLRSISDRMTPKEERHAIIAIEIYAPLAYRLGMFRLAGELEDLSFPHVYPQEYDWLMNNIKDRYNERERYAQMIKPLIEEKLSKNKIKLQKIDSRAKRYYSLYRKLKKIDMDLESVYDLVAIRCIVPTIEDCYAALGVIHKAWQPVPGRIKDYIALPKENNYQSLHTSIYGPDNKIIEIQIRTPDMHNLAENGIAAHWLYKQFPKDNYLGKQVKEKNGSWVSRLKNWRKGSSGSNNFIESFNIDLLIERTLVLTPKGMVVDLPQDSTPVDFAYRIHSEIGHSCIGSRINNENKPLHTILKTGDVVDILIQKNKGPSEKWLDFVKTNFARNHIRSKLRQQKKSFLPEAKEVDLRISVEDRIGLLKDISETISRSHINITDHRVSAVGRKGVLKNINIRCSVTDKNKIEKLVEKLKSLDNIKSVAYRLVR